MSKCETCGHEPRNIKRTFELIQTIAAGLNRHNMSRTGDLEVYLYKDGKIVLKTGVATALDYLANDIWWNEEGEWDKANRAEVRTL